MFKVKGTTYNDGKVACRCAGDRAEADKAANRLLIVGNVVVESLESPKASMKAKKVEWLPDLKVFKASGDVLVEGEGAVVGPASQLYASPDLKKIGTSKDYFKK